MFHKSIYATLAFVITSSSRKMNTFPNSPFLKRSTGFQQFKPEIVINKEGTQFHIQETEERELIKEFITIQNVRESCRNNLQTEVSALLPFFSLI